MLQSTPNYPLIWFFAGLGVTAVFLTAYGWRHDPRPWRIASALFSLIMFAQAGYEFSFAFVPVREWIRVDLLLTIPMAAIGFTVLLGRALLRWLTGVFSRS